MIIGHQNIVFKGDKSASGGDGVAVFIVNFQKQDGFGRVVDRGDVVGKGDCLR